MIDSERASCGGLAYLCSDDATHMVDVTTREPTVREATAVARAECSDAVVARLSEGSVPKGDVFVVARAAGTQAAKKTPALPPLTHVVDLHGCEVDVELADGGVAIRATARIAGRTGVEMETLTAVAVAVLAAVDMVKGIDRSAVVAEARIVVKSDGRSGSWVRPKG